jgi:2-(1,2-epoxy-1,2-dihydrophenyl)acetyl-CoA isomerase
MTSYDNIILEEESGVAILTLNNPESRNPLTDETKTEMISALDEIDKNTALRAMVITGKGKAFCAGGDLKKIGKVPSEEEIREIMGKSQHLLKSLLGLEKPVIAAVNGDAFGMGCNLALASDFVLASDKARFCEVFVKLGITPDFGALYFLPRLVGLWKSKEMAYLGNVVDAIEAEKIGLITRVVPQDALMGEAMGLAKKLAGMPTLAIGRAKRILNKAFDMTLSEVLEEEIKNQIYLTQTEDHAEGLRALMEKRKPEFQGK